MTKTKTSRPLSKAAHSLPGPDDIHRFTLPNGMTVLCRSNFNSPSVVISGYLQAGSIFDPDDRLGLAEFTAAALMRGTARRDFQQIYDALESVGASLGINSGVHNTGFSGRALSEDLPLLLGLLAETLREPVFPSDQVERLRAQLLTRLSIRAQDTGEMAGQAFDRIVFANHPYSRPDEGLPETIRAITTDDLAGFHRNYFGPAGMVIAIVGAVEPAQAVREVENSLGDWTNPAQPGQPELPPLTELNDTVRHHVTISGKSQSDIVLGTAGPTRKSPEYMAAALGNSVLGQFGMMGRIGDVVRERSGLAYYAYSSLSTGIGPGSWEISAGVNPANIERTIALIKEEIDRFVEQGVTAEELKDSQDNFIGRLPLSLESNAGVANAMLSIERYDLGMDYYQRYAGTVAAVTPEEVLETARKYLGTGRLAIATAGP